VPLPACTADGTRTPILAVRLQQHRGHPVIERILVWQSNGSGGHAGNSRTKQSSGSGPGFALSQCSGWRSEHSLRTLATVFTVTLDAARDLGDVGVRRKAAYGGMTSEGT